VAGAGRLAGGVPRRSRSRRHDGGIVPLPVPAGSWV